MLTAKEKDVMRHALGLPTGKPYRNHFCASEADADWQTLLELCGKGLMKVSMAPNELSGGSTVFSVTDAGKAQVMDFTERQVQAVINELWQDDHLDDRSIAYLLLRERYAKHELASKLKSARQELASKLKSTRQELEATGKMLDAITSMATQLKDERDELREALKRTELQLAQLKCDRVTPAIVGTITEANDG